MDKILEKIKQAEKEAERIVASSEAEKKKILEAAKKKATELASDARLKRVKYSESEIKHLEEAISKEKQKLLADNNAKLSNLRRKASSKIDAEVSSLIEKFKDAVYNA